MRKAILVELLLCVFVIISAYDKCGIPKIKPMFNNITNNNKEGQIVGGEEAIPHSYPWMIRLLINYNVSISIIRYIIIIENLY